MGKKFTIEDKIISLKVDDAYAVWFKASKKFLLLEKPAFFVLDLILKDFQVNDIIKKFSSLYKYPLVEVESFITEIAVKFNQFLESQTEQNNTLESKMVPDISESIFFSKRAYKIGEKQLNLFYGDKELEFVIHPLISHFELYKSEIKAKKYFIYRQSGNIIFQIDNEITEQFEHHETGFLKAAFLLRMLSFVHHVDYEDWMITLHASAVSFEKNAILFSAAAGKGKSTLSALLHANGFHLLSDDFLAMNVMNRKIYQVPVATTIKKGSYEVLLPHYPELENLLLEKAYTGKEVRYLPINTNLNVGNGYPVRKLVFVEYSKKKEFSFLKMDKKSAIKILLEETWIKPNLQCVTEFFNWFDETQFFSLIYSETTQAVKITKELFSK